MRVIDLCADVEEGEYPLYDLFRQHGRIIFQLYAGCSGCDFTKHERGIPGIGFAAFIVLANSITGDVHAGSFAAALWREKEGVTRAAGFGS